MSHVPQQPSFIPVMPVRHPEPKGMAVASMVCGILGVLFSFVPLVGLVAWPLTIVALALGGVSLYSNLPGRGMAITGVATGSVGLFVCVLWVLLFLAYPG
ncbi:DUF4190 domain-containing protein [Haloactinomyces albus]|uniref:Lysylphosphatidylglycerol synthetase-like protein (DUF2156 family) n=1 Tax=Haloactinomyces albus TaxID=1352928 RepID=A0AAE4CQK2_9ACTN|nr:DUF4190 domain-containing protein [Haloactinomyces albus]MDR7304212.1 lysylphosphatidylglycerol synthetase-like protein (DUF2156 family) [Haloactinomyces albus]